MASEIAQEYSEKLRVHILNTYGHSVDSSSMDLFDDMFQSAIDEAMKPAADVEALTEQLYQMAFDVGCSINKPMADQMGRMIQVFLTAHDRAKDAEIERLKSALGQIDVALSLPQRSGDKYTARDVAKAALRGASDV